MKAYRIEHCRGSQARPMSDADPNQANIQPVYEVYANLQGRDLGSVADEIGKTVAGLQKELSPGNSIQVLGQIQSMNDAFRDMAIGVLCAAALLSQFVAG